jgi:hypothetical protein
VNATVLLKADDKLRKAAAKGPVPVSTAYRDGGGRHERTNSTDPPFTIKSTHQGVCLQSPSAASLSACSTRPDTLDCTTCYRLSPTRIPTTSKGLQKTPDRSCNLNLRRPTQAFGTSFRLWVSTSASSLAAYPLCRGEACTVEAPYGVIVEACAEGGQFLCS